MGTRKILLKVGLMWSIVFFIKMFGGKVSSIKFTLQDNVGLELSIFMFCPYCYLFCAIFLVVA